MASIERLVASPDLLGYCDSYQQNAVQQVQYDDAPLVNHAGVQTRAIYGYPETVYHYISMREEFGETQGPDDINPRYNRLGALMSAGPVARAGLILDSDAAAGEVTEQAVQLHLKEFGDLSWHTANYLSLHGIKFSEALRAAQKGFSVQCAPNGQMAYGEGIEDQAPFFFYWAWGVAFLDVAESVLARPTLERRERLAYSAGRLLGSMANMVRVKFDVKFEDVLAVNKAKVDDRIARHTIFKTDQINGDLR